MLSIIIPVYNVENYLERCLDSILLQTYSRFELILVDDGSTDSSGLICDRYAKDDTRIVVIHQPNGGLVCARQRGIREAIGGYIMAVDSDDWIEANMLEEMMGVMQRENCDIVLSGMYREYPNYSELVYDWLPEGRYDLKNPNCEVYGRFFLDENDTTKGGIRPNLWSRLFKRECIYENQLKVDKRIKNGEDDACFFPSLLNASAIYVMHKAYYHYRQRSDSLARKKDERDMLQTYLLGVRLLESVYEHEFVEKILYQAQLYIYVRTNTDLLSMKDPLIGRIYQLPYSLIDKGDDVVIYGAGKVGSSYIEQIRRSDYCSIVGCIDQKPQLLMGYLFKTVESIQEIRYDKILLATVNEEAFREMRETLLKYGVNDERIIWQKYKHVLGYCIRDQDDV